jgi:hypothetical protein
MLFQITNTRFEVKLIQNIIYPSEYPGLYGPYVSAFDDVPSGAAFVVQGLDYSDLYKTLYGSYKCYTPAIRVV